jgi:MraZ protein
MGNTLIGSYPARFDKSGRIKIPEKFRAAIEEEYGAELFITSLTDEAVQIYPLPVWNSLTGIAGEGAYHFKPSVRRLLIRVNSKGTKYQIDSKGRVLINQALRDKAKLEDEVEVIGLSNHLEIWNKNSLEEMLGEKPLTDEDFENIAELMSQEKSK